MTSDTSVEIKRKPVDSPIVSIKLQYLSKAIVAVSNNSWFQSHELLVRSCDDEGGGVYFNKTEIIQFAEALLEFAKQ